MLDDPLGGCRGGIDRALGVRVALGDVPGVLEDGLRETNRAKCRRGKTRVPAWQPATLANAASPVRWAGRSK